MKNTLLSYMNRRLGEEEHRSTPGFKPAGPVITISREVGCGGISLSQALADELNKSVFCKQWQVISKEVLSESAKELKVRPEKVDRLFSTQEHSAFDEILAAFTDKYYKSNRVIMKTVREVIHNFAVDGCCIIVGRAGHLIAADIENALHIRLVAPLKWRIESLVARKNMTREEAQKYIHEVEKERTVFRDYFRKDKHEAEQFDVTIDMSSFEMAGLIKLILTAFELKGIPARMKRSVPYFG